MDDVKGPDPTSFFINDENKLYYAGILPAGGPTAIPATWAFVRVSK